MPYPDDPQKTVADVEAAWASYRADIQQQVEAGRLPEAEGREQCSERHKAAWMRQYLSTRCGLTF